MEDAKKWLARIFIGSWMVAFGFIFFGVQEKNWWWLGPWVILCLLWTLLYLLNSGRNLIVSMFLMLLLHMIIFASIVGACFVLFPQFLLVPFGVFVICVLLYLLAEVWAAYYMIKPWPQSSDDRDDSFHVTFGVNLLKGWGGAAFADFTTSIGVLVVLGMNMMVQAGDGNFWWAGQIAAMLSVMGAAAWVQRYTIEDPKKERDLWHEYVPNFLSIVVAMLTAVAVLVPTPDNKRGIQAALLQGQVADNGIYWFYINWLWIIVFGVWFLVALIALICRNHTALLSSMSSSYNIGEEGKNRGRIGFFLGAILVSVLICGGIVTYRYFKADLEWNNSIGYWLGLAIGGIYIVSQVLKVFVSQLQELNADKTKVAEAGFMDQLLRDMILLFCSAVILVTQAGWDVEHGNQPWIAGSDSFKNFYVITLGLYIFASFLGVWAGTYRMLEKWREPALGATVPLPPTAIPPRQAYASRIQPRGSPPRRRRQVT
jgi:hypothetical protein